MFTVLGNSWRLMGTNGGQPPVLFDLQGSEDLFIPARLPPSSPVPTPQLSGSKCLSRLPVRCGE